MQITQFNKIIVGVDGSPSSNAALEWAAQEAEIRGSTLELIHAWNYPNLGYGGYVAVLEDFEKDASALLDEVVAFVRKNYPKLQLVSSLIQGPTAQTIMDRAKEADMVVVGSRGRGGFSGLLLGSVGQQLVHHCPAPVVIIHLAD
ncbi:MAG: universal stress protein [Actinomycetota bacterium]|jgi:nucleotide-binding universal stress UspA family protein|nr:universal stress protein [Actinomycetota bacterium]